MMNKFKPYNWSLLLVVLFAFLFVGCEKTDIINNSYKALAVAGISYDTTMKTVAGLQAQGIVTADQRTEINKYANIYYSAYQASVKALEKYKVDSSDVNSTALTSALSSMSAALVSLMGNINRIVPTAKVEVKS
jgi:hypothetical protein